MRLQRLADVRVSSGDTIFRQSSLRLGTMLIVLVAAAIGVGVMASRDDDLVGRWIFGFAAMFLVLFAGFVFGLFRKTLMPANWLVRVAPGGDVTVKFRSYANAHFSDEDVAAFTLAPQEIRWARASSDRTITANRSADGGGVRQDRRRYLDLAVDDATAAQVDEQLRLERGRLGPVTGRFVKGTSKLLDYPVSVIDGGVIRIEWRGPSTWITPKLSRAIALLSGFVNVATSANHAVRDLSSATPEDAEAKIFALAESGDEIAAMQLSQTVYGGSLADARERVQRLTSDRAARSASA
jgi:hypothetical protein